MKSDFIVAIDQALGATGLAVFYRGQPVSWKVVKTDPNKSRAERRAEITKELATTIMSCMPGLIVVEKLWEKPGIGLTTSLIDLAFRYNIPIKALHPVQWKAAILATGRASKEAAVLHAREITGDVSIKDDNIADAICIGECAHKHPKLLTTPE